MPTLTSVNEQFTYVYDLEETRSAALGGCTVSKEMLRLFTLMGGFFAAKIPPENLLVHAINRQLLESDGGVVGREDAAVFVLNTYAEVLSENQLKAMLAHEVAHIRHGDIDKEKELGSYQQERMADQAAVKAHGAQAMRSALTAILAYRVETIVSRISFGKKFFRYILATISMTKVIRMRLKALDADIKLGL